VYVDAAAAPGGTGSRACPVRTISQALAIQGERRIVHVAAGFYDKALGEQFPLELRGNVALVGAGADRTTISGVGTVDLAAAGGSLGIQPWRASLVLGDRTSDIRVEGVTVTSGVANAQVDTVGLLCTRGDPARTNTRVVDVVIGGPYGDAVIAGAETKPSASGCSIEIERARIHDVSTGIWQVGCGMGEGATPTRLIVRGSIFTGLHAGDPTYPAHAISVWDCARETVIETSRFFTADAAIGIVRHPTSEPGRVVIRDNLLDRLTRYGIRVSRAVTAEIRGNRFSYIAGSGDFVGRATALWIHVADGVAPELVVRDNTFVENDLAIEVLGAATLPATTRLDLGRADDPGRNTFLCNSAPEVSPTPGGDVAIRIPIDPGARVELAGNRWDHAPPTRATLATNGLDVLTIGAPLAVDLSTAEAHGGECDQRQP
jgi:hypothetical protein